MGTLEKTVFKGHVSIKGFSRTGQGGQCPHSDENMLEDRNKKELIGKQVCQKGLEQETDGCGGWKRKGKKSSSKRLGRVYCSPLHSPRMFFNCIPG